MDDIDPAAELLRYPASHRVTHYPSPDGLKPLTAAQALAHTQQRWRSVPGEDRPRLLPRPKHVQGELFS